MPCSPLFKRKHSYIFEQDADDITSFLNEVRFGDLYKIQGYLERGFSPNVYGNAYLLSNNKNMVDITTLTTPINQAIFCNNFLKVKLLIESGASVNAIKQIKYSPLQESLFIKDINIEIIKLLLIKGAEVNDFAGYYNLPIHIAILQKQNTVIIKLLLENGADPNIPNKGFNIYPLHQSVANQDIESTKLLIEYGAKINVVGTFFWEEDVSVLQRAIDFEENHEIVKLLLEHGADINFKGLDSILFEAFSRHNKENSLLDIILEHILCSYDLNRLLILGNSKYFTTFNIPRFHMLDNKLLNLFSIISNKGNYYNKCVAELWDHAFKLGLLRDDAFLLGEHKCDFLDYSTKVNRLLLKSIKSLNSISVLIKIIPKDMLEIILQYIDKSVVDLIKIDWYIEIGNSLVGNRPAIAIRHGKNNAKNVLPDPKFHYYEYCKVPLTFTESFNRVSKSFYKYITFLDLIKSSVDFIINQNIESFTNLYKSSCYVLSVIEENNFYSLGAITANIGLNIYQEKYINVIVDTSVFLFTTAFYNAINSRTESDFKMAVVSCALISLSFYKIYDSINILKNLYYDFFSPTLENNYDNLFSNIQEDKNEIKAMGFIEYLSYDFEK